MLSNGQYSAWFKTPLTGGVGVVELIDGRISGGDTVLSYDGSYSQTGDLFTATIATRRHTAGQPGIFGIDDLEIELQGHSKATTAICAGHALQQPDVPLEVILVRIED